MTKINLHSKGILKRRALKKSIQEKNLIKNQFELNDDQLKSQITNDLEKKIEEYNLKYKSIKEDTTLDAKEKLKKKKYIKEKLRKLKKKIQSQDDIQFLLKNKKKSLRKLKSQTKKIENLEENEKKRKVICFNCRKKGHTISECKANKDMKDICFNCGSNDHNVHSCSLPVDYSNMPYAKCFICGENGHLSSKCIKNENKGIYVKGGGCHVCGSNQHLAKNCPDKQLVIDSNLNLNTQSQVTPLLNNKTEKNIKDKQDKPLKTEHKKDSIENNKTIKKVKNERRDKK